MLCGVQETAKKNKLICEHGVRVDENEWKRRKKRHALHITLKYLVNLWLAFFG